MIHRAALLPVLVAALAAGSGCASRWEPRFHERAAPRAFESVEIAAPSVALTFARTEREGPDGRPRVLAVASYRDGAVSGVDLGTALGRPVESPVALFRDLGYDGLLRAIETAPPGAHVRVDASSLIAPEDFQDEHVAVGTNFPEHAGESGVEEGPFLFPKLVRPTAPRSEVSAGDRLLDYEVEVAWVPLGPLAEGTSPASMGLVLSNDFTDRATLLRHVDVWNVESGDGFTTGKSFDGSLPVGDLFVIPRDFRTFVPDLELRLYVDDALRQRSRAGEMVWDFDRVMAETWARRAQRWEHRGRMVSLPGAETDSIPERTLILSGTPHGTVFDGVGARPIAKGALRWLLGGWSEPPPAHVVAAYIDEAKAAGAYLQPGSRVVIHVDRMGLVPSRVVP